MILIRWFFVFIFFTIEVRVKALELDPSFCIKNSEGLCSVYSTAKKTKNKFETNSFKVSLGNDTLLFRDLKKKWNLVRGSLRVENKIPLQLKTKVGVLQLNSGIHFVKWEQEKLWVMSLLGQSYLELTASKLKLEKIPQGLGNWYGPIGSDNLNNKGVLRPLNMQLINEIGLEVVQRDDVLKIKKNELRTLAMVSELYKNVTQNMEDDYVKRVSAIERAEERKQQRAIKVRQIFRSRYLSPVTLEDIE